MRCFGITKRGKRCKNKCKYFFCRQHKWLPVTLIISAITVLIFISDAFESIGLKKPVEYLFQSKEDKSFQDYNNSFKDTSLYNILLLPFGSSQNCELESVICEREIESRFRTLSEKNKFSNIELVIHEDPLLKNDLITLDGAKKIGEEFRADLVLWGDYVTKCSWDSTKVRLNWYSLKNTKFSIKDKPFQKSDYKYVKDITELEKGILTGDVEEIIYWFLGMEAFKQGDLLSALSSFYEIDCPERKECAHLYFLRGQILHDLGEYLLALKNYRLANSLGMEEALLNAGLCYFALGQHDEAKNVFDQYIVEKRPKYENAIANIASIHRIKKDLNKALGIIDMAIQLDSSRADFFYTRGLILYDQNKINEAIESYNYAIKCDPNFIPAYLIKANDLTDLGRFEEAIAVYNQLLEIIPDSPVAICGKANIFITLGELDIAKEQIQNILNKDSINLNGLFTLGNYHFARREFENVVKVLSTVISKDSSVFNAFINRGIAYSNLEELDLALKDMNYYLSIFPYDVSALNHAGIIYGQLEKYNQALSNFNLAIKVAPENPWAYENRGILYRKMGRLDLSQLDLNYSQNLKRANIHN